MADNSEVSIGLPEILIIISLKISMINLDKPEVIDRLVD